MGTSHPLPAEVTCKEQTEAEIQDIKSLDALCSAAARSHDTAALRHAFISSRHVASLADIIVGVCAPSQKPSLVDPAAEVSAWPLLQACPTLPLLRVLAQHVSDIGLLPGDAEGGGVRSGAARVEILPTGAAEAAQEVLDRLFLAPLPGNGRIAEALRHPASTPESAAALGAALATACDTRCLAPRLVHRLSAEACGMPGMPCTQGPSLADVALRAAVARLVRRGRADAVAESLSEIATGAFKRDCGTGVPEEGRLGRVRQWGADARVRFVDAVWSNVLSWGESPQETGRLLVVSCEGTLPHCCGTVAESWVTQCSKANAARPVLGMSCKYTL